MNVDEIVDAVMEVKTDDELRQIWDACSDRRSELAARAVRKFKKGDKVTFLGKDNKTVISGVIKKVNRKTCNVETGPFQTWRVCPSLLTKV